MEDLIIYLAGLGSCGETSTDSDHIVALSQILYDQYTYGRPSILNFVLTADIFPSGPPETPTTILCAENSYTLNVSVIL